MKNLLITDFNSTRLRPPYPNSSQNQIIDLRKLSQLYELSDSVQMLQWNEAETITFLLYLSDYDVSWRVKAFCKRKEEQINKGICLPVEKGKVITYSSLPAWQLLLPVKTIFINRLLSPLIKEANLQWIHLEKKSKEFL